MIKIGIDISALQGAHRMRGIGYVAANFVTNLPISDDYYFVFYLDKHGKKIRETVDLITLDPKNYEIRYFEHRKPKHRSNRFSRMYGQIIGKATGLLVYKFGDNKYPSCSDLDCFIQLDQSQPLPRLPRGSRSMFIAYDLIPFIMEADYLHGYYTSRKNGKSRKASLKAFIERYIYIKKIRFNVKKSNQILAISHTTKKDFIRLAGARKEKITVITLGVSVNELAGLEQKTIILDRYKKTSWGYLPYKEKLESGNFLLFVGGADDRRRLQDLVAAFNHLRARGNDIRLVLSGDIMKGPLHIPNPVVQKALLNSSYKEDIYFLGFTDDQTRDWLYDHALAFVFPSVYEGFGLPVLEAMGFGTPVVCYNNNAVNELTADIPYYANDVSSMIDAVLRIQNLTDKQRSELRVRSVGQASLYTWKSTATQILNAANKH